MKFLMITALLTLSLASHANVRCSIGLTSYNKSNNSNNNKEFVLEQSAINKFLSEEGSMVIISLRDDTAHIQLTKKDGAHAKASGQMTNHSISLELNDEVVRCRLE